MPKVSVIICAYNAEDHIKTSVQSVLDQSFEDFELIVVNDGSTDTTEEIANKLARSDGRIKVISIPNGGLSNARNIGLKTASGEYVAFQDADDTVDGTALEAMLKAAVESGADMVVAGYYHDTVLSDGTVSSVSIFEPAGVYHDRSELFRGIVGLKSKFILDAGWNKLYRHSVISENGLQFPVGELFEDTAFVLSYLEKSCRVAVLSDCFYHYMQRQGNSITKRYSPRKLQDLKKRYFEFSEFCDKADESVKAFCSLYYIKNVFSALANSYSDSSMSNRERKALILEETEAQLFKACAKTAKGTAKSDRLTVIIAKCNFLWLTRCYCRTINYMKTKMSDTFAKIK